MSIVSEILASRVINVSYCVDVTAAVAERVMDCKKNKQALLTMLPVLLRKGDRIDVISKPGDSVLEDQKLKCRTLDF